MTQPTDATDTAFIEAAKDMTVAELREVLATVEAQRAAVSGEVPHVG